MKIKKQAITHSIWLVVLVSAVWLTGWLTYTSTKKSYFDVGYRYGTIDADLKTVAKLKQIGPLERCDGGTSPEIKEVITVKTTSLYAVDVEDSRFRLCIME